MPVVCKGISYNIKHMLKVKVIMGSTREGRHGGKVGEYIQSLASTEAGWEAEYLDLKALNLPMYAEAVSPSFRESLAGLPEVVQEWSRKIEEADAYIIVTPEYNHGYPAPLKNAIDWLFKEWNRKPVAFVSYGALLAGGRAVEQLRQVVAELHMTSIRAQVLFPAVWEAFDESGEPKDKATENRVRGLFKELTWWGNALKVARESKEA
ncbi:MAG: NADPH-dependent oxidoreductase [Candidatus Moraniibacteriota bacterium]|nr:MAG: NADPH-dependent oxidoreductase [Candidatus Moranbacteria bacterium]